MNYANIFIDIGATAIRIAAVEFGQHCKIIALEEMNGEFIHKNDILNITAITETLFILKSKIESTLNNKMNSAIINISSSSIISENLKEKINITNKSKRVSPKNIKELIKLSLNRGRVLFDENKTIIHDIEQLYIVDENIKYNYPPIQVEANILELAAHCVAINKNKLDTLKICLNNVNLKLDGVIYSGIASSLAVLNEDNKEKGACVIDIGAISSDITIWFHNTIIFNKTIPFGGNQITRAIENEFGIASLYAENIKKQHGAINSYSNEINKIVVPNLTDYSEKIIDPKKFCQIIETQYLNFIMYLRQLIHEKGLQKACLNGIVLTGNASKIRGLDILFTRSLNIPTRIAQFNYCIAENTEIDELSYSTLLGMVNSNEISKKDFAWNEINSPTIIEILKKTFSLN